MTTGSWSRLRRNFFTGLALVLPAVVSIAILLWLFGTVSNVTNKLLFLVPPKWKHADGQNGEIHWYWSVAALLFAVLLITLLGQLATYYIGKKLIELSDSILMKVPLLNRIYSTLKQVKDAFAGKASSFQQTVLVEFPSPGIYSLGFITGIQQNEIQWKTREPVLSVFVPTTPNPTSGFLLFLPESRMTRLEMSVADAIKAIISLGAVTPPYPAAQGSIAQPGNPAQPVPAATPA